MSRLATTRTWAGVDISIQFDAEDDARSGIEGFWTNVATRLEIFIEWVNGS